MKKHCRKRDLNRNLNHGRLVNDPEAKARTHLAPLFAVAVVVVVLAAGPAAAQYGSYDMGMVTESASVDPAVQDAIDEAADMLYEDLYSELSGTATAAQWTDFEASQANEYPTNEFTGEMCFEAPEGCENIGDTASFCGGEYLCAAVGTLAAAGDDPTFRQCIDKCFAASLRAKAACDSDYANDLRWCDRNARRGWRRDTCYYLAGQTRNLCYAVASAELTGCLGGCGIAPPLKGLWRKIAN